MMFKYFRNYFIMNALLFGLGLALSSFNTSYPSFVVLGFIGKNILLSYFLLFITQKKEWISTPRNDSISHSHFIFEIAKFSITESWIYLLYYSNDDMNPSLTFELLHSISMHFIWKSFLYETIFDFMYYWNHRSLHSFPFLYKHIHKTHHYHQKPTIKATFHESLMENILANVLPSALAVFILKYLFHIHVSSIEFCCLSVYKSFVEISGHCGKQLGSSSSFPQLIWLPKLLGTFNISPSSPMPSFPLYVRRHRALC